MSPRGAIRQSRINLFRICGAYFHQKSESSLNCSKWLGACLSPSHYPNQLYLTLPFWCWLYWPRCLRKTFWCWGRKIPAARGQWYHYSDVIMGAMAFQITSLANVYPTVYSGTDQRKHRISASLAFVRGIHRWPVNSAHKWPVTRKMFPLGDVIMMATDALAPIIVSISAAMILALYDKGALVLLLVRYSLLNLLYFLIDGCIYDSEAKRNNSTLGRLLKSLRVWKPNKKYTHKQHDGEYLNRITN